MINIKKLFFVLTLLTSFFYSNNCVSQKINQFNKNKKRTGIWKKYHPNKRIRYLGQFKNGKEIGVFKFYDISTSRFPIVIKTFSEDTDSVFVQFFTLKGKLQSEGKMLDKKRIGKWTYFFPNGKKLSEENYADGKLEGEVLNYYPNGKLTEQVFYINGLKNGTSKKYSSDGILIEEIQYQNGIENGIAKYFELNGKLKEKGTYKNGKRVGKWDFYLNGEIATAEDKKKKRASFKKKKDH